MRNMSEWDFFIFNEKNPRHFNLSHRDEKLCTLKNPNRKSPTDANIKFLKEMFAGRNLQLTIDCIYTRKLNSHTRNRLQRDFKETERISHSKKKIRTKKESLAEYFKSKHVGQNTADTDQERRSSDRYEIERSHEDDSLENDEDVGDLCEANICKIKTYTVKQI